MYEYQRGQILLIVVLITVTALTIGLSVAARSVTNTRTSEDAANSEKAFSAAEAGVEQSLTSNSAANGTFNSSTNTKYSTTLITVAGTSFPLNNGSPVLVDSPADLWLSSYPINYTNLWNGTFTVYWGKSTDVCTQSQTTNTMAALEIIVLSGTNASNVQSHTYDVDPCNARATGNGFQGAAGGGTVSGTPYNFGFTVPTAIANGLLVRIIPLYASTGIAVTGCNAAGANCTSLPVQGTVIQSTGTSENTERQVVTYRYNPVLPSELFQYNLFAP